MRSPLKNSRVRFRRFELPINKILGFRRFKLPKMKSLAHCTAQYMKIEMMPYGT